MVHEQTGTSVPDIAIMMVAADGQVEVFKEKAENFYGDLGNMMDDFWATSEKAA